MHNVVIWFIKPLEIFEKVDDIVEFWKNSLIIEADFDSSFIDYKLASDNWSLEKSTRSCVYFMKLYSSPKTFVHLVQIYCLVNERNYDVNYISANVLPYDSHKNLCQIYYFFFILYCRRKMSGIY